MLLFATGVFVVAILFYGFISDRLVESQVDGVLNQLTMVTEEGLKSDSLCSSKQIQLPSSFTSMSGNVFYDVNISTGLFSRPSDSSSGATLNFVNFSIIRKSDRRVIGAKSVVWEAKFFLGNPFSVADGTSIGILSTNTNHNIVISPRGAYGSSATSSGVFPLDMVTFVREVVNGKINLYLTPCSSKVVQGCSKANELVGTYLSNERGFGSKIPECFINSNNIQQTVGTS